MFGKMADQYGRKTVLTYTLISLGFAAVGSASAQNKWQFLAARSLAGACIGANFAAVVSFSTEVGIVQLKPSHQGLQLIICCCNGCYTFRIAQ